MRYSHSSYNEDKKPLYYNDYYVTYNESEKNYEKYSCIFVLLFSIFIFLASVIDICYSYISIDSCQTIPHITTLNDWLRINGIFGIAYYFFMMIIIYSLSNVSNKGYVRLVNQQTKTYGEKCEIFYKVCATFLTVIMFSLISIGSYIYFSYIHSYCKSEAIVVYMWIRLITGFVSSFGLVIFINY